MTSIAVSDDALPGLGIIADHQRFVPALSAVLSDAKLGGRPVSALHIERMRYRPGKRAILSGNLEAGDQRAVISLWLHAGSKAIRHAAEAEDAGFYEPMSNALVYVFPTDPRMPAIARFMARHGDYAPSLVGKPSSTMKKPGLVRYRPGVGVAFCWQSTTGESFFVKLQNNVDARIAFGQLQQLWRASTGTRFGVPSPSGMSADLNAYAMTAVAGQSLRDILSTGQPETSVRAAERTLLALQDFRRCGISPGKMRGWESFVESAVAAAAAVGDISHENRDVAKALASRLRIVRPRLAAVPTHGDLKPEHVMLAGSATIFLDLDDITLSDPGFDLAMLRVRIAMLAEAHACAPAIAGRVSSLIRAAADGETDGLRFAWLEAFAALQLAKHYAQSLQPDADRLVRSALDQGMRALAECDAVK